MASFFPHPIVVTIIAHVTVTVSVKVTVSVTINVLVMVVISMLSQQESVRACREAGLNLELADVAVQSLVPEALQNVDSADEFMQQLPQYDADLARQVSDAEAADECLRFVGKIHPSPSTSLPSPDYLSTPHTPSFPVSYTR